MPPILRLLRYALPGALLLAGPALIPAALIPAARAQNALSQPLDDALPPTQDEAAAQGGKKQAGGEHFRATGHRSLPLGYQDTPSTEFEHGPDPDHLDRVERDSVTGANLSKFGPNYQQNSPTQSGQLGDATGNGWVAPRGNGW